MKKLLIIVVSALLILTVASFFKDTIVKVSVEKGVEVVTGLKMETQGFRVGIIKTLVGIKNLRLFNPAGFRDRVMLDMPEIYVDYNLPAIFGGKVHLEEVRIDMREFVVVKNEKGELNLDSLKVVQAQKEGMAPGEKEKGKAPRIQIDNLGLKIGKVVYKDYSKGGTPSVREFNVNLDEKYTNISNPYAVVSLIVVKALMHTTIAGLADFDLQGLQGTVSQTLASAQEIAGEVVAKAQEVAVGAQKKAEEVAKEAGETIKKTTESLKETLKLPFGAKEE